MAWYVQENTISIYTSIHLHIYAGLYYTSMHLYIYTYAYLVVSWHGGTPSHHRYHDTKVASFWMIWGYPYFRKPPYMYHICIIIYIYTYIYTYIYIYIYIYIIIYLQLSTYHPKQRRRNLPVPSFSTRPSGVIKRGWEISEKWRLKAGKIIELKMGGYRV